MITILLLLFYVIAGGIFLALVVVFGRLLFSKSAPFIPIPQEALEQLLQDIQPKQNDIVYDLGCGDARVLLFLAEKYPEAMYKGIELRLFPFILARWKTRKTKKIHIIRGNFFETPLGDATHIITYLFPSVMNTLLPKLEKELKRTTLVSFDFKFEEKKPIKERKIPTREGMLGSQSFLYIFE